MCETTEPIWDGTHYRRDKPHVPPFPTLDQTGAEIARILAANSPSAHRSDGGSTDYYAIPAGITDLDELIDSLGMSFRIANIFKACMRFGKKDGTSQLYDLNKIIFFASREKNKLLAVGGGVVPIDLPLNRSVT